MTTLTIEKQTIKKTNFVDFKELFDYAIDNQIITELGYIDEKKLSKSSIEKLNQSKISSNRINI